MEMDEELLVALLERVEKAVADAERIVSESGVLRDVSRAVTTESLIARCAWCGRYRLGGGWVRLERPMRGIGATHGICPDCVAALKDAGLSR
jgi:hypothetical protein